jgi:hypothetical protein
MAYCDRTTLTNPRRSSPQLNHEDSSIAKFLKYFNVKGYTIAVFYAAKDMESWVYVASRVRHAIYNQ